MNYFTPGGGEADWSHVRHWARLQNNIPADLLPRCQKDTGLVQLSPDSRCADVPDCLKTSAVQPTICDSNSFNFKCQYGRLLAPNRCNLGGGGLVWDVVLQPSLRLECQEVAGVNPSSVRQ